MFRINIELPSNASSEQTLERAILVRQQVLNSGLIEIEKDYWFVGRMSPRVLMNVVGGKEKQWSNNMAQSVFYAKNY